MQTLLEMIQNAAAIAAFHNGSIGNGGFITLINIFGSSGSEGAEPTERMRIDAAGNVGIGETLTTAGVKLHITNATQVNQYLESSWKCCNSILQNGADGNSAYVYNRANLPLTFGTNNTERMRIDSNGNVGIVYKF